MNHPILARLLLLSGLLAGCDACQSGRETTARDVNMMGDAAPPPRLDRDAGDAGGLRYPLERVDQLPSVPWGTPAGELLYDFGSAQGTQACAIHVDGDGVYWALYGRLFRGSHDGRKAPELVGKYSRGCGYHIATDATHVYWLDGAFLKRRVKTLEGAEEAIALKWDHSGGDAVVSERYVYVAMPGCPSITRIDKVTLEQEFTYQQVPADGVGDAALTLLDDGSLYCGSWSRIFHVVEWGSSTLVYSGGGGIEGVMLAPPYLVWLDRERDREGHSRIGRMLLDRGEPELFVLPIAGSVVQPFFDATRNRVVFLKGAWLAQFDLSTHVFSYLARDHVVAFMPWGDHLYWAVSDITPKGDWAAIRRVPLDTPPLFVFPKNSLF